MRLKCTTGSVPLWFKKFVGEEWGDEYRSILGTIPNSVVEFFKSKGITAWHEWNNDCIWLEIDLDDPVWTMRMLKYEGATC